MSILSLQSLEYLATIYLVANTPDYLYDRYRAEQAVQVLGREKSATELVSIAVEVARDQNRSPTDLAAGYAAIVALTFRDYGEVKDALREAQLDGLEWTAPILEIWRQSSTSTVIVTEHVRPNVQFVTGLPTTPTPTTSSTIKAHTGTQPVKTIINSDARVNLLTIK